MSNYVLCERKDLAEQCIIAFPENIYSSEFDQVFYNSGTLSGIDPEDFKDHHSCQDKYNIPIEALGRLSRSSEDDYKEIKKGLESICKIPGLNFDREHLISKKAIYSEIFDSEIVEGNLFIIRYAGERILREKRKIFQSFAYFVSPEDGELRTEKNKILVGSKEIETSGNLWEYLNLHNSFYGKIDSFNSGKVKLHRKSLRPYHIRYGPPQHTGPWILKRDSFDEIDLALLKESVTKELKKQKI